MKWRLDAVILQLAWLTHRYTINGPSGGVSIASHACAYVMFQTERVERQDKENQIRPKYGQQDTNRQTRNKKKERRKKERSFK